jgi:anthranilate phosphoribosyltransferase
LNAAAALYAANVVNDISEGLQLAKKTIESGAAKKRLEQMVELTHALAMGA